MVGIDATLDEIESFLSSHQWGTVYSFLMNKQAETIFHPRLKPSTKVRFVMTPQMLVIVCLLMQIVTNLDT